MHILLGKTLKFVISFLFLFALASFSYAATVYPAPKPAHGTVPVVQPLQPFDPLVTPNVGQNISGTVGQNQEVFEPDAGGSSASTVSPSSTGQISTSSKAQASGAASHSRLLTIIIIGVAIIVGFGIIKIYGK
jgi:hypothetical protein